MTTHSSPHQADENIDKPSIFMVGWLTSLAQEHLKIIKTDNAYAKYSSGLSSRFYLIQTAIKNKKDLETVGYIDQAKDIAFDVYIHQIGYCNTRYNQLIFWFKDKAISLYSRIRRKAVLEKEVIPLSRSKYLKLYGRAARRFAQHTHLLPSLMELESPLFLRFELLDSLPCGLCQFKITPVSPLRSDADKLMDKVEEVKKFIFDMIHPYFHQHHFCKDGLKSNIPVLSNYITDISEPDNDCLKRFIRLTTKDLVNKLDDIYRSYGLLLVNHKIKREKGQKRIGKKKLIQSSWSFFNDCDNLIGIHAFLSTLLNSPENKSIKIGQDATDIEDQHTAMLIESSHKGTIALMQKISHHEDFRNQKKSINKAIIGIWTSVAFSLISILVSIYFGSEVIRKWVDDLLTKVF